MQAALIDNWARPKLMGSKADNDRQGTDGLAGGLGYGAMCLEG